MGRSRYKIYDERYPYFITSSIVGGYPLFSIPETARIVLEGFTFLQEHRKVDLYGYVIMENHIHFVAIGEDLAEKVRLFKSYSAREVVRFLKTNKHIRILRIFKDYKLSSHKGSTHQIWQEGFHPKQILNDEMMIQKLEYIHMNPVKRGYVDNPEDWRYTSARNYMDRDSLIEVKLYER